MPPTRIQQISELFDQWARSDRATQMAKGHQHLMDTLLAELSSTCAGSLLDLGCGTGKFLALADAAGFSKTCGIDASTQMIAITQNQAPNAEVKVGQFEKLPWPGQSFDHVTSIEALYYCPDPQQALQEIVRVLKTCGRFDLIIDYYADSEGTSTWDEGLGFEITRLSIAEWVSLAESAGLQNCQTRRIIHPKAQDLASQWTQSVWYPTRDSYENYLQNGAFWLTADKP